MATWKILGQDATTSTGTGSTGRQVLYTNATTDGVIAWALIHNRSTANNNTHLWASTSTGISDEAKIYEVGVPTLDTFETGRVTLSTGDSVIWAQATTGISISLFGAEGISTG